MLCSLWRNVIGDKGASALAAVLKETQITTLQCAAASECLFLCQRPLTRALFVQFEQQLYWWALRQWQFRCHH